MALRGRFIPKFPEKYAGDPTKIFFRSSWESSVMKFLDSSQAVLKWGSEELSIPYLKPTDMRVHNYFPDFVVVYKDRAGNIQKEILEVKPLKETLAERAKNDYDKIALAINVAKWKAAEEFAKRNGMRFRVITEKSIFQQGKTVQPRQPKTARRPVGTRGTRGTRGTK